MFSLLLMDDRRWRQSLSQHGQCSDQRIMDYDLAYRLSATQDLGSSTGTTSARRFTDPARLRLRVSSTQQPILLHFPKPARMPGRLCSRNATSAVWSLIIEIANTRTVWHMSVQQEGISRRPALQAINQDHRFGTY